MDTKLKKYNRARRTGIIITGLAAALFVALFPLFEKRAMEYNEAAGREGLESEEFVGALIRSNYVFYKNVMDKSGSKIYSYEELYTDKTVKEVSENTADYDGTKGIYDENGNSDDGIDILYNLEDVYSWENEIDYTANVGEINSITASYVGEILDEADAIQRSYTNVIGTSMDYYVLDKITGTSIKNTSLPIEDLLRIKGYVNAEGGNNTINNNNAANNNNNTVDITKNKDNMENYSLEDIESAYDYYIIMDYDSFGNLQNISVKGQDADRLLKMVQNVESSGKGRLLLNHKETETYELYDEDTNRITKLLNLRQKKPANAVFVYAVTDNQMRLFQNKGYASAYIGSNFGMSSIIYSYHYVGVDEVLLLFIAAIFAITALLAVFRPLMLEGTKERKAPIEATFAIVFIFLMFCYDSYEVVEFVANVESGDVLPWVSRILELIIPVHTTYDISAIIYGIIKYAFSFLVIALIFGIWYFCCLEVSDITRGVKNYICKRSLIYICIKKIFKFIKERWHNLKAEIKNADLGKDMDKLIKKLLFINFGLLTAISCIWIFGIPGLIIYSCVLYYFIKKYIKKIRSEYLNLLEAVGSIAQGNLNNTFDKDFGIFESSKEELYEIQNGFKNAVDKEVKSQMMKTELITNVSHDLKTPLTAIITYIDLMKEENITEEQKKAYLDTLERKSLRLKVLIEDLFEISKASSGNISLDLVPVDICSLMRQVYLEHEDKIEQAGLQARFVMPEEKVILQLDSQKTYRIFENLYGNIIKYALPDTRVFITAKKNEEKDSVSGDMWGIRIEIKNISAQEIVGDPQYLSERFVRGDASRNTEGSGLGLAIARSFTELQGGTFRIETDGDLFKVILEWGGNMPQCEK